MTILFLIIIPLSFAIVRIFNDFLNRFSIKKHYVKYIILLLLIIYFLIFITVHYWDEIKFLYAGLGIGGTSAHSSGTRINQMLETFEVFLKSPLIGYSLGGIPSAIGLSQDIIINSQIEAKNFEGMNVFLEILAASGIIGFLFFLLYLIFLFFKAFSISRKLKKTDYFFILIVKAFVFSLFWELMILMLNQNIFRPYLWILIGMLNATIFVGRESLYETYNYRFSNA
ncbi:hypothetical protein FE773_01735 [Caminibacter mediatlanticus TB-2]|uniref:O-antigen ligase-related domain-containing protein n=2 Tax=Caminibacter mediatlanticus TaxID=291048 RepID=A0ABX5V8K6_9BACT|nr:hypothetical protein FE773_01735 [Caminibacter mediatlanticus TB-2]